MLLVPYGQIKLILLSKLEWNQAEERTINSIFESMHTDIQLEVFYTYYLYSGSDTLLDK